MSQIQDIISANTRIFHREDPDYKINAYQYATSSHEGMDPNVIIYPTGVQEIIDIVDYARMNRLGVAVRTGGHQYSGASSTSGENILIDLSDTFEDPEEDFQFDEENNILRIGISFSLQQHYTMMAERGIFTPGGLCSHVHLGGHFQTGGYGMLVRSFGILSDLVEGFDMVLADGGSVEEPSARAVTVWKPDSEFGSELIEGNDDLFWAVMGGSPGNLGVLTHVRFRPLHDRDYPDSRMMKYITKYSPERHRAVESILVEMAGDPELPSDYNGMITIMGGGTPMYQGSKYFNLQEKLNEDEMMMHRHGEQYGDGVFWAEQGCGSGYCLLDGRIPPQRTSGMLIMLYATWHNVNGESETFPEEAKVWFSRLREAGGGDEVVVDYPLQLTKENVEKFFLAFSGQKKEDYAKIDYNTHIPMSKQLVLFSFAEIREYNQSVYKRTYFSDKYDLLHNGYMDWIVQRMKELAEFSAENDYSVNVVLQNVYSGGRHSVWAQGDPRHSSHSWRKDVTYCVVLDVFYDPHSHKAKEFAKNWAQQNDFEAARDGGGGILSDIDIRFFWASFGKSSDPDHGMILDSVWDKYFDSREKYDRLVAIKRRFDPDYVFTANSFGVDATSAPYKQCKKIIEK